MTKIKRGIIYFIIMAIILTVLVAGAVQALKPDTPEVSRWVSYRVKPGDTLWSIVPAVDGYDIRDMIDLVIKHNDIQATGLIAYDVIELPIWEAE